jgi:hypothetical protein
MKLKLVFLFFLFQSHVNAQLRSSRLAKTTTEESGKYFSFNPFALAEPHLAAGVGFGNHFTERSEYFTELSYIGKQFFYDNTTTNSLHGVRWIAQYRYHFLHPWQPLFNIGSVGRRGRNANRHLFLGAEFRVKPFTFSASRTFVKEMPADTLHNFVYKANAVCVGGAILMGEIFDLSADGKWKLEATIGIGARIKTVHYKNIPTGYKPLTQKGYFGLAVPVIDEPVGLPYVPCAIRLRYCID